MSFARALGLTYGTGYSPVSKLCHCVNQADIGPSHVRFVYLLIKVIFHIRYISYSCYVYRTTVNSVLLELMY